MGRARVVSFTALILAAAGTAPAQLPRTRVEALLPPGGQAGTTLEVRVSGEKDLDYETAPRLVFDHPGIKAEAAVDPSDGAWKDKAFRVTIDPEVPPGRFEARLDGHYGASNPLSFRVEIRPTTAEADDASSGPSAIEPNHVRYGRIEKAAGVEEFLFEGPAEQTIVLRCDAAGIGSPLQPFVELFDPAGRPLGQAGGPYAGEATLAIRLPVAGTYRISLSDAAFRGGDDFAYRLVAATEPVVAFVRPPAAEAGQSQRFDLFGYNLPDGEPSAGVGPLVRKPVDIVVPSAAASPISPASPAGLFSERFEYWMQDGEPLPYPIEIFAAPRPLVAEAEPNDGGAGEAVTWPTEISGTFGLQGDADRFGFDARKGAVFVAEVFSHRYGSPADPVLKVERISPDGTAQPVANSDDQAESFVSGALNLASSDPSVRVEMPEDGRYRLTLHDRYASSRGGPALGYRLSIRKPEPDFRLLVVPFEREKPDAPASDGAVALRRGGNAAVTVVALRRDGFDAPIAVRAEDLPAGVASLGVTLGPGIAEGPLVLSATDAAAAWRGSVRVVGEATVAAPDGTPRPVVREAVPVTVVMNGKDRAPRPRLARSLVVSVLADQAPFALRGEGGSLRVLQGSQAVVPLRRTGVAAEPITASGDVAKDSQVSVETEPLSTEAAEGLARLKVAAKAPARSYVLTFTASASVEVAAFPFRLARAKATQERARAELASQEEAVKHAASSLADAQRAAADPAAGEGSKQAVAEKEALLKAAEELRKAAESAKDAADRTAADAEKAAAPKKLSYSSPAAPLALTVCPAPTDVAVTVPNGGAVARGSSVEVTVAVKRRDGYDGPIELALHLPAGATGVSAEPVTVEAGRNEAVMRVAASADAPPGALRFPAIRATFDAREPLPLDTPVTLAVAP